MIIINKPLAIVIALSIMMAATAICTAPSALVLNHKTNAQILEKDPPLSVNLGGNATDLTRDVSIDVENEVLPANGTVSISTEGADDIDIQSMPQAGQTFIIDNHSATVTSNPVNIGSPNNNNDNNG